MGRVSCVCPDTPRKHVDGVFYRSSMDAIYLSAARTHVEAGQVSIRYWPGRDSLGGRALSLCLAQRLMARFGEVTAAS